ncbi:hypothetical protein RUM44_009525 [Polyplax serrata]|uniref:FLYWCH-type domain-containing protein n=1 Tax=Polyplax serrata TaxID=468196 RepID=A0ABR1AT73_POLSC
MSFAIQHFWRQGQPFKLVVTRSEFELCQTPRGTPRLTYEGYKYGIDKSKCNDRTVIWKCTLNRKCTARANLNKDGTLLLKNKHSHPPPLLKN